MTELIERFARFYPFYSGAGRFANSALFRWIDAPGGPDRVVRVEGGRALIPAGDHVGRAMRFVGDLDPKISSIVDRALQPGDVALDIGANLGLVGLRMAARVGQAGEVHLFEPQPRLIGYLKKTLALNPDCRLTLHTVALGADNTELVLQVPYGNAGAASFRTTSRRQNPMQEFTVPVRRLDTYAEESGLSRIDFVKVDVEGFEASVIEGGAMVLKHIKPHVILLEENGYRPGRSLPPALKALKELDYRLYALPKRLFSMRLLPLANNQPAHDFVAVAATAPERISKSLGL